MSPNFRIAFRFLTAKKRAMLMSLSCTILGVGLFIVTQATTSGFEEFFVQTILGSDGALLIEDKIQNTQRSQGTGGASSFRFRTGDGVKYIEGIEFPDQLRAAVEKNPNVTGTSAVVKGTVTLSSSFKDEQAQIYGINLAQHLRVSDLQKQIVAGSLADFERSPSLVLIGRVLADRLQLSVGSSFTIKINLNGNIDSRRYKVGAIYETGIRDIDKVRVYVTLPNARSMLRKASGASFIQVNLKDPNRAPLDAAQLQDVLQHSVKPWQERQKEWLQAFRALKISSAITVLVFTLIASLAMFNTLAMIVLEKTKDIAILRSMGYERRDITRIFLWQAVIVLVIGAVLGTVFGLAGTWGVSRVPLPVSTLFKTSHFLVSWTGMKYFIPQAISTAVVMVMIASLVPARRAARLEPGDIVRGTAQ